MVARGGGPCWGTAVAATDGGLVQRAITKEEIWRPLKGISTHHGVFLQVKRFCIGMNRWATIVAVGRRVSSDPLYRALVSRSSVQLLRESWPETGVLYSISPLQWRSFADVGLAVYKRMACQDGDNSLYSRCVGQTRAWHSAPAAKTGGCQRGMTDATCTRSSCIHQQLPHDTIVRRSMGVERVYAA